MIKLIKQDINTDKLKLEAELQRLMNLNTNISENISEIKMCLRELTILNNMINLWDIYTSSPTPQPNNEEEKPN